ncbi:hypothetical protein FRC19_008810 [Serendipita sp. 401]|nr:hypothetical protein FRC19_008810 [Serendipita sp. 401]
MLWSFFAVGLALALVVKYLQPHTNLPFVKPPSYDNNRCTKVAAGEMFFIYGIVCLSESVFFSMLVYKAYQTSKGASRTPILKALILQGTMYYFVVLIILAITMFAPFSEELYFPIANALIIVPITWCEVPTWASLDLLPAPNPKAPTGYVQLQHSVR